MRYRAVAHIVSVVLVFMALSMLLPICIALADEAADRAALLVSWGITLLLGVGGFFFFRDPAGTRSITHREAYLASVLGWVAASLVGALPFFFYAHLSNADPQWLPEEVHSDMALCDISEEVLHPGREFCSITDSVFESVSGITTTGASVIRSGLWDSLDSPLSGGKPGLPRGFLMWRCLIQWLGGMGILVLAVTALSLAGGSGMHLMRTEVPGPTPGKVSPRVADTARLFWKLYVIISLGEVLALMAGGMDWYNAVAHTCTTMATGGYSTLSASIAGMNSAYFEWVITLFMMLAGTNFALHYGLLFSRHFNYHRDSEFKAYSAIFLFGVVTLVAALGFAQSPVEGVEPTLRSAAFQTASILTTTGYATRNFALWPVYAQLLLLILMFVGGCAGSTGGGMKVVRMQVMVKVAYRELVRIAHPRSVSAVRYGKDVVDEFKVHAIVGVVIFFICGFVISTLIMAALGLDPLTAISSVAACIGNVGPGLGDVGPTANYYFIPASGKWLLMFNMLAGRLEMFTVLILLSPHFWRR